MKPSFVRRLLPLGMLTVLGVLVEGYHPGAQDDGIYLAAIYHNVNPALFRMDSDFVVLQLQATAFDKLMGLLVRITHLPVAVIVLAVHLLAIFAILAACYRIASRCFEQEYARWCGVALVAVLFTLPVAQTSLCIVDENLHPRAIATALVLYAVDCVLGRRFAAALALIGAAFLIHPIMAAFGLSLCFFLAAPWPLPSKGSAATLAAFAFPIRNHYFLDPPSPAWRAAVNSRKYLLLSRWTWGAWVRAITPVFLLLWFARMARRRAQPTLDRLATRLAVYGVFQLTVALLMALPALERFGPLQPMRYLHLLYVLTILLGGCFIGEHLLRQHRWRWAVLFLCLGTRMFLVQRAAYPASPHLELPGVRSSNPWLASFEWIRENTPEDAYFALGPEYLRRPGEDNHGFRALALRSALADNVKTPAVVTQVPGLADRWQREVAAQNANHADWQHVSADDLRKLKADFGVNWVILEQPAELGLACPYRNSTVEVCRI